LPCSAGGGIKTSVAVPEHGSARNTDPASTAQAATSSQPGQTARTVLLNVQAIADLEAQSSARRSRLDRLSDRVSDFAGSTSFLLIHVFWFSGWITLNSVVARPLDPYPFTFLTFLVSLEAIFLTSFVLISQNHLENQARRRAAIDLQINLLAEREMTSVLKTVTAIATHLGVRNAAADEELQDLIKKTDVKAVAQSVEVAQKRETAPPGRR
jgi:uncharacterized membrane protein